MHLVMLSSGVPRITSTSICLSFNRFLLCEMFQKRVFKLRFKTFVFSFVTQQFHYQFCSNHACSLNTTSSVESFRPNEERYLAVSNSTGPFCLYQDRILLLKMASELDIRPIILVTQSLTENFYTLRVSQR